MFNKKSKKNIPNHAFRQTDSFIVDLRRILPPLAPAETTKIQTGKQKLKLKSSFSFWQKKSKSEKKSDFLERAKKIRPLAKQKRFFHISLFAPRSWRSFFRSPRPYYRPFFFFRRRFHPGLNLNQSARRHFSRIAALRWRRFKKLGAGKKQERVERAEHLVIWYRSLFAFIAALVFIILPFKLLAYFKILDFQDLQAAIMTRSFSAFDNLASASDAAAQLNLTAAGSSFARASSDFSAAQQELSRVNDWLLAFASFSNDPKIKLAASGKKFLAAGMAAANFGQHLSAAADVLLSTEPDKDWGKLIDAFVKQGGLALISAKDLQTQLKTIDANDLPTDYRDRFLSFRDQADLAVSALESMLGSAQEIKDFLGVSQDKRYLLVFQNNSEMRGAGGFLGSYALVDIRGGRIRKLEVPAGGSYDTEAGMKEFIKSPQPLWLVSPRWYFWDANWWPDWPTSARSLMWFYEKSGGPTVDGVISFTPDVLEDLLRITGPIDMQTDYGLTIDADNFRTLLQETVEKDNLIKTHPEAVAALPDSPKNQPKKIIGDLMARIMDRLPQTLTVQNMPKLLAALEKNLSAKNILLYFNDPALGAKISRYRLDGALLPNKQDYLLIAHTNIAGQKSDLRMVDKISHDVQILADGGVIDTLTIYRTHTGVKNEILSGVRNVDWLRVYVPQGSRLLAASGFRAPEAGYFQKPEDSWEDFSILADTENQAIIDPGSGTKIYEENGKTVFANWVMTDPGETSLIRLRYRLPFKVKTDSNPPRNWQEQLLAVFENSDSERLPFSLLVQKQPGARPAQIDFTLRLPEAWRQLWNYPQTGTWNGAVDLNQDFLRAVILEK